jgi:hypothetical protein
MRHDWPGLRSPPGWASPALPPTLTATPNMQVQPHVKWTGQSPSGWVLVLGYQPSPWWCLTLVYLCSLAVCTLWELTGKVRSVLPLSMGSRDSAP